MEFTNKSTRNMQNDVSQAIPHTPDTLEELVSFLGIDIANGCLGQTEAAPVEARQQVWVDQESSAMEPITPQHLAQKSGGPFDRALPDVTLTDNHVASAEGDIVSMTTAKDMGSELDLYNLLKDDGLGESSDMMANKDVDDFVDLFEFLLQNDKTKADLNDELPSDHPSTSRDSNVSIGQKRSYDASSDSSTIPSDHSGYVKVKRTQHQVSAASLTSDTESETGSSQGINERGQARHKEAEK